ncbi:Dabb family protein [Portibacter marinus]|uniref:Dabb family protein n=1 Tax=Portibacter marinus TaxID=2898660 RepID=UPI001F2688A4|nr:Dabb family protein [Portibacter marinus]
MGKLITCITLLLFLISCSQKVEEPTFVHTVFFWMKDDLTEEEAKFFEEGMEKLGQTPSIHSYKWGKPAGTPRDVVDNSYTYAWIVEFANTEDHDAYQEDPIHVKFIEESSDLWTKVQVYDTILE